MALIYFVVSFFRYSMAVLRSASLRSIPDFRFIAALRAMSFMVVLTVLTTAFSLSCFGVACNDAFANAQEPKQMNWVFDGVFGKVDKAAAQRGFQVYKEVCATCHSLKRVAFRNLEEIGFSKEEVEALASEYEIKDGPNDEGEMYKRAGKPYDYFPLVYKNDKEAAYINNGIAPPDLSLMIKARVDGANYVYSMLTGYGHPVPEGLEMNETSFYNPYFAGGAIAMPPPLMADMITYQDGTEASVHQMSSDIVNFLQWTAEPEMQGRKEMGVKVMIFLFIMTLVFFLAMKAIWAEVE